MSHSLVHLDSFGARGRVTKPYINFLSLQSADNQIYSYVRRLLPKADENIFYCPV